MTWEQISYDGELNPEGQTIEEVFNIDDRQVINRLRDIDGDMDTYRWLRAAHEGGWKISQETLDWLDLGLAEGITGNIDEVNKAVAALNDSTMAGIESDIAVNASYAGNMAVSSGYVDDRAVYNMLAKLVDAVGKLPGDIGEEIAGEMNGTSISLNNREFGRLVRAVV